MKALADLGAAYNYRGQGGARADIYETTQTTAANDESTTDVSRVEDKARQIESTDGYEI